MTSRHERRETGRAKMVARQLNSVGLPMDWDYISRQGARGNLECLAEDIREWVVMERIRGLRMWTHDPNVISIMFGNGVFDIYESEDGIGILVEEPNLIMAR